MDQQIIAEMARRVAALEKLANRQPGIEQSGGGGGGTPSGTVVSETAFGQASTAGAASAYSRGDHSHGTPANPVTAHEAAGDPHTGYALESNAASDLAATVHAATGKTTPIDADELPLIDSAASYGLKKLTWTNLKATLLTWLGTLLDSTKISKLYESDGGGPTVTVDASGVVSSTGKLYIDNTPADIFDAQLYLTDPTHSNADAARNSRIDFRGYTAAGVGPTTILQMAVEHDGVAADYKGRLRIKPNDGAGSLNYQLDVNSEGIALATGGRVKKIDTDGTLAANLDTNLATQKAVKTYVDAIGGVSSASESAAGIAELATQTETDTGTDDARIVTPLKLKTTPIDHLKVSKIYESDAGAAALSADATGYLSAAVQPLVVAYKSSSTNNVTGDGTVADVVFDTEITDRNSNYNNSTGVFTAPVTGKYLILGQVLVSDTNAAMGGGYSAAIVNTSNRSWYQNFMAAYGKAASGYTILSYHVIADMDTSDTAKIQVYLGGSTKTADIFGDGSNYHTMLGIYLLP